MFEFKIGFIQEAGGRPLKYSLWCTGRGLNPHAITGISPLN